MMNVSKIRLTLVGLGPRGAGKTALAGGMARLQGFLYGGGGPLPHPGESSLFPVVTRYQTRTRQLTHVDLPGHVDPLEYLLPGRIRVDGAIVVLDPGDMSPAPWLARAERLGAPVAAVFVNKADVAWPGLEQRVAEGMRAVLDERGLEDVPVLFGSALQALRALESSDLSDGSLDDLHALARRLEHLEPAHRGRDVIWA